MPAKYLILRSRRDQVATSWPRERATSHASSKRDRPPEPRAAPISRSAAAPQGALPECSQSGCYGPPGVARQARHRSLPGDPPCDVRSGESREKVQTVLAGVAAAATEPWPGKPPRAAASVRRLVAGCNATTPARATTAAQVPEKRGLAAATADNRYYDKHLAQPVGLARAAATSGRSRVVSASEGLSAARVNADTSIGVNDRRSIGTADGQVGIPDGDRSGRVPPSGRTCMSLPALPVRDTKRVGGLSASVARRAQRYVSPVA